MPEIVLDKPDFTRARRDALGMLKRLGIEVPPVDPVKLAREQGLTVYFARFSGESVTVTGFYDCEDNAIFVNSDEFPLRQTFTVAHELGHFVMHKEWARSAAYKILMRDSLYSGDDTHEKESEYVCGQSSGAPVHVGSILGIDAAGTAVPALCCFGPGHKEPPGFRVWRLTVPMRNARSWRRSRTIRDSMQSSSRLKAFNLSC